MRMLFILAVAALALLPAALPAQKTAEFLVPIAAKLERPTQTDAEGLLQFAPHQKERCVNCKGRQVMTCLHCARFDPGDCESCPECKNTTEATCRICAGTGEMPDILQRAPCPTCFGAALTPCFVCGGKGKFPVAGGGDRKQKCGCCDGKGAYPCSTCDGKRHVDLPVRKPTVTEAKAADLEKAIAALGAVAKELEEFASTGDGRKDAKAFAKVAAAGGRHLPAMKAVQKHFDEVSKRQAKGAVWTHYADAVKSQADSCKQALAYYLEHQQRVLQLCLARAVHNEEVLAAKKKK